MNDRVTGLILREQDYKENSVIVRVLTKEYGKISFVGQGVRKMTSKNRGSLMPYTKAEILFDYKDRKTMFRLKSAHTLDMYRVIHEDLNAGLACSVLAEIIDESLIEGEDPDLSAACYDLFEKACCLLQEGHRADVVVAAGLSELLSLEGIEPDVDECVLCGKTSVTSISVKDGGFLCEECAMKHGVRPRDPADLKAFRLINKATLDHVGVLEDHMESAVTEASLLVEFIRMHLGLPVRSYALFQRMYSEN